MKTDIGAYARLAARMGVTDSLWYPKILENQLTPDECQLLLELGNWTSVEQVAKRLGADQNSLQAKIDDMVGRKFVLKGKEGYAAIPNLRSFPHGPDNEMTEQLWHEFYTSGEYPKILVAGWEYRLKDRGFHTHKVIPARQALAASTNLQRDNLLWYEDIEQILRRAKTRNQSGLSPDGKLIPQGCNCRKTWHACDYRGGCTGWEFEGVEPGRGMTGIGRRDTTIDEALAYIDDVEDQGLVHISPNSSQVTSTCNCCPCCCSLLHTLINYGNVWQTLAPSRFRAVVDQELCQGCQTCVERCHFDAIEMRKVPGSKKMKAYVINEHCMGCGLCIFKCERHAMRLELVRPAEHIPTAPMSAVTIVRSINRPDGVLYNSLGRPVNP